MDFSLTKDQELIRTAAREFFEKECPMDIVRQLRKDKKGYDPKMWKKMTQLEFQGLAVPEEYGGTGGSYLDLALLMEEIGKYIVLSPFFTTVCQSVPAILKFGTDEQKKKWLPEIVRKGRIWSFAQHETAANYEASDIQLQAVPDEKGYRFTGRKLFVPYANVADKILVVTRSESENSLNKGISVFAVDKSSSGLDLEIIPTTAGDSKCEVEFENVLVKKEDQLGESNQGSEVIEYVLLIGSILKSAEMLGGAVSALHKTARYTKKRVQFGRPIATLQALQHRLARMLTQCDGLRAMVYEATWKMDRDQPDAMLNSMVKAKANEIYHEVCFNSVYIHGAIGWTEEMDVGQYMLQAQTNLNDCGGSDLHYAKIGDELENSYIPQFLSA
jgi:alkylation response protein AidB-like acyl-CoA dehydrogenase